VVLRDAITEALASRTIELATDSVPWPAGSGAASNVRLRGVTPIPPSDTESRLDPEDLVGQRTLAVWASGTATLGRVCGALAETGGASVSEEIFLAAARTALNRGLIALVDVASSPLSLASRVRLSDATLYAEAQLSARELQDFAEAIQDLMRTAPEMTFAFRMSISAEGAKPSSEIVTELNQILSRVSTKWKLE